MTRVPVLMAEPADGSDQAWLPYLDSGARAREFSEMTIARLKVVIEEQDLPAIVMYSLATGVNSPPPKRRRMTPVPFDLMARLAVRRILRELALEQTEAGAVDKFVTANKDLFETEHALELWIRTANVDLGGQTPLASLSSGLGDEAVRALLRSMVHARKT